MPLSPMHGSDTPLLFEEGGEMQLPAGFLHAAKLKKTARYG